MKSNSKNFSKALTLIFTSLCLLFCQTAFAGRLSGGKSYGMKRSYSNSNRSYSNSNYNKSPNTAQPATGQYNSQSNQTAPKSGMSAGTGMLVGAAAGAAAGYMLGKNANNHNNASDVQNQQTYSEPASQSHIPWGMIAILGVLLFIGLVLFRRIRPANINTQESLRNNNNNSMQNSMQNSFDIPSINRGNVNPTSQPIQNVTTLDNSKMPDGIETVYFLRQAKGTFLHVQSMNNKENISEIAKYMTDELYNELSDNINNNQYVADFTELNCELVNTEIVDNKLIASVKYSGMVSDEPNKAPEPFTEIWHFVKTDLNSNKWLIAGIEQAQ